MMTSEQSARLLRLADFLDTLPPERFNFAIFASSPDLRNEPSCGTTACALGWATTMPEFQALGLGLYKIEGRSPMCVGLNDGSGALSGSYAAYHACKVLFGLSERESRYLFFPDESDLTEDATAGEVADHIREFVAKKGTSNAAV